MTLSNVLPRRAPRGPRQTSVALIMFVMMSLVFGPVIGLHLFAAFTAEAPSSAVVSHSGTPASIPPG
ncbi:hypothetical protein G3T14_02575 [Methylobacterium sp. BTF04]|uniref:hypothetical protein n=1 Tax=Methylobacterium sp. BTF04 TaxID=2708300 RepID=UPI0013CFDCD1|nr:hypothetical protein [Methylobacterium sp. BTF04]NEU11017.1 hypothetical protein [Methylobacterium sp. BTF04]